MVVLATWATLLTGCAPSVVTDMFTKECVATSPDSVRVFQADDDIPSQALEIGKVKVVDGGLAIGGSYERVLGLAVKATAKNGGNGLVINEHRLPDGFSSIHRVWGTMLYMPQSDNDTSVVKASFRQALARSLNDEYQRYEKARLQREQAPRNILRLNIGPSWLMSKCYVDSRVYKSKCGVDVEAGYDYVWKSGFGLGFNYLRNYTSINENITMRLNYFGPSFVMALPLNRSRWDVALGLGYCKYSEYYKGLSGSEAHIAPLMRMGWEYKVGEHLALGLQMTLFSMAMDKPDDVVLDKDEFYGIKRWGLMTGMRYYF